MADVLTDLRREAARAFDEGDDTATRRACGQLLELAPTDVEARRVMARVALRSLRFDEAARWLRELVARTPDDTSGWFDLARALCDLGRLDEAEAHLDAAAACGVRTAASLVALGAVRTKLGRPEDARAAFEAAIDADQTHGGAYYALACVGGLGADDPVRARAERLLRDAGAAAGSAALMRYGLAEADLATGDLDAFCAQLDRANTLELQAWANAAGTTRSRKDTSEARLKSQVRDARKVCAAARRGARADAGVALVFVLGDAATGAAQVAEEIAAQTGAGWLGASPYLGAALRELERATGRTGVEAFERASARDLQAAADAYLERVRALAPSAHAFVDELRDSVRFAPVLSALFPSARLIKARRDPMDEGVATWRTPSSGAPRTSDLGQIGAHLVQRAQAEADIAQEIGEAWREVTLEAVLNAPRDAICAALEGHAPLAPRRVDSAPRLRDAAKVDTPATPPGLWLGAPAHFADLRSGLGVKTKDRVKSGTDSASGGSAVNAA